MKRVVVWVIILTTLCLGVYAREERKVTPASNDPSETALKRIASSGEKERLEILSQFGKARSDLQLRLIKELNAATENDKKFAFVYLMGLYRLERTVPELTKIIDLKSKPRINDAEFPYWDKYPVVEALVKIGRPAVPAMLENIKAGKGEKIMKLSVKVIRHVETPIIAKIILEDAIAKENDPTKVGSLRDALKYLKTEYHLEKLSD